MYLYLPKIGFDTQIFNFGQLSPGHAIFTWASMWGSVVSFRSRKRSASKKCLGNNKLYHTGTSATCWYLVYFTIKFRHQWPVFGYYKIPALTTFWHNLKMLLISCTNQIPSSGNATQFIQSLKGKEKKTVPLPTTRVQGIWRLAPFLTSMPCGSVCGLLWSHKITHCFTLCEIAPGTHWVRD